MAFIGQAVSDMEEVFETKVTYMFITQGKADSPRWISFMKIISPLNEFVTVFPIQMHRRPNLTIKSRVIIYKHCKTLDPSAACQASR